MIKREIPDSPEDALEFIGLLSLLAKQLDRAQQKADPARTIYCCVVNGKRPTGD
jgi:hypothetical protein